MMVEIKRLLVVVLAALACVGMWNCGYEEWGERVFADHFGSASIVGFIDDSLVIVADNKEWTQETPDYAIGGRGHQRLRVFNYRVQEDGPRWTDTLDNFVDDFDYVKGQLSDSVVWGGDTNPNLMGWQNATSFSFWKIGEHPHLIGVKQTFDGCSVSFPIASLRVWRDGKIFAKGNLTADGDSCQYAILDTIIGMLTYKRLGNNLKWIETCDDIRVWDEEVYCLKTQKQPIAVLLLVDEFVVDSIDYSEWHTEYLPYRVVEFDGGMVRIQSKIYGLDLKENKIKNEPNVLFSSEIEFIDANGNMISY